MVLSPPLVTFGSKQKQLAAMFVTKIHIAECKQKNSKFVALTKPLQVLRGVISIITHPTV